jgi:predicted RNase H-like nuclease (RuvC/YqgF family)
MSMKNALGPPPQIPSAPLITQPPMQTQTQFQPKFQFKPSKKAPETVTFTSQNKNPTYTANLKTVVDQVMNSAVSESTADNFRNISNIIGNPALTKNLPAVPKVELPSEESPKMYPEMSDISLKNVEENQVGTEDLQEICGEHDRIVSLILEEEEEMIAAHRQQLDEIDEMSKLERQLLNEVDKPGSDIEEYTNSLDSILANKMEAIASLRKKLAVIRTHLNQEKELSKKFFEQQNEINDVFDLNGSEKKEDEDVQMLTSGLDIPMFN